MIETLSFVRGAIAKKDFAPALTHFCIRHGRILGFNGTLAISSPISLELNVNPKAAPFIKAIQLCKDTVKLNVTATGRLSVVSGKFRAFIDCYPDEYPNIYPEGEFFEIGDSFLSTLHTMKTFIAEDASRPWARGVLFRGQSAYATNNIALAEYWTGFTFPMPFNLPKDAITEILRIGINPIKAQVCESSITFYYPEDRWLRTQLYPCDWPNVDNLLNTPFEYLPVPEGLWEGIETLLPFVDKDGSIFFTDGEISCSLDPTTGAAFTVEVNGGPCFNADQLLLLKDIATGIDFSPYPSVAGFKGDRLRGVIAGMRRI